MKNFFSSRDLDILTSFVGSELNFVAGPELWEYLSSDLIILVCGENQIAMQGDIFEGDFEGFQSDYSKINFLPPKQSELKASIKKGFTYYFHAGEIVTRISIIRDRVVHLNGSAVLWDYQSDSGVVFHLTNGAISISKLGYHDEMLQVTYFDSADLARLPDLNSHFESDLYTQYEFERKIISLPASN